MWRGILASLILALAYQNSFVASFLPSRNYILAIFLSTLFLLAFLVAFVNFYIGKDLRKCSPLNEHLAYVNEETQSSECIKDLNKVANPKGLSEMWRDEIENKNVACRVLLTGVTGYVGSAFLFRILREIAEAEANGNNNPHKVYVMTRPKARKRMSAAQRLARMKEEPMFATVQDQWDRVVVAAESGDLQEDKCGMSPMTLQMLADANVTHVVHCAADVNFNRPLADSAGINITPVLQLQALARAWPTCKRFVHCSTAFVNPGCGSPDDPMPEDLFSLGRYNAQELFQSMRGDQKLALEAKADLQFPNNYVFTKCVAEHLLVQSNQVEDLRIIRPAIIGPAWVLPEPGWNGDKPSTITALFLLWGTRVVRFAPLNSKPTPMVPVDVVAVGILDSMIAPAEFPTSSTTSLQGEGDSDGIEVKEVEPIVTIRNLTWSHKSPHKFVDSMRMAKYCIPVGVLKHHFTATEAAVSFALIDASTMFPFLYHVLHRVFNLGPLKLLQFVCWVGRISGIKSILDRLPVTKLLNFSDMLTLYRPYLARPYFFESSFNVPASLSMNQYCITLFTATHAFWTTLFPGTVRHLHELQLMPKRRFDLWWALTLPCGTFTNRLIGYLARKIIGEAYGSAEVNFVTLFHAGRTLLKLEETMDQQKHCVVLAPTNRSSMDYLLAKYIAFSMVGLGIDVPVVYAEPEFNDPTLCSRIGKTKQKFDRHATLAAFLEGAPSQDGRLQKPQTKFLKDLVNSPGNHNYTIIPVCIDYDRIDNNQAIKEAIQSSSDLGLLDMIKLYWRVRSFRSIVKEQGSFGDVRISFGVPTSLDMDSNFDVVAGHVQNEHRRLTTVSEYQIAAAEHHLDVPADTLRTAMEQLGTNVCKNKCQKENDKAGTSMVISVCDDDMWRLHLQWMPRLAPYLADTHETWAQWTMGGTSVPMQPEEIAKTTEMDTVIKALCKKLESADSLAQRATQALQAGGSSRIVLDSMLDEMGAMDADFVSENLTICKAAASFLLGGA